ncbi:heme-binding protein [Rhizobium rhizogenes]|uniref:heme-binding protein n=1 Tax=Rhizobium rhizogenes TaxID=359 RepID=UPI001F3298E4|nr:heme-binding protein [Rhizobium rhizogenes]
MNTAVAESLISIAQAEAARARFAMCITVLDATPHLVAFARRDGANIDPIDVGQKNARATALFQTDSINLGEAAWPTGRVYSLSRHERRPRRFWRRSRVA